MSSQTAFLLATAFAHSQLGSDPRYYSDASYRRPEVFVFSAKIYNATAADYLLWDWTRLTTVCVWHSFIGDGSLIKYAKSKGVKVGDRSNMRV